MFTSVNKYGVITSLNIFCFLSDPLEWVNGYRLVARLTADWKPAEKKI